MVWHIIQCNCLELHARITWIQSIAPKFKAPSAWMVPSPLNVVGAITADLKIAEYCFRVRLFFPFHFLDADTSICSREFLCGFIAR